MPEPVHVGRQTLRGWWPSRALRSQVHQVARDAERRPLSTPLGVEVRLTARQHPRGALGERLTPTPRPRMVAPIALRRYTVRTAQPLVCARAETPNMRHGRLLDHEVPHKGVLHHFAGSGADFRHT